MTQTTNTSYILSTRSLSEDQADKLRRCGLHLEQRDFIVVSHRFEAEAFAERLMHSESQARIFTSKNAVYSLRKLLAERPLNIPPKKTFTVGIRATEMLAELGIKAKVRADNAISLAQIIARNADIEAVDFFCGNQSLDDLPEYLSSKNITVNKEIVYHTELEPHPVETDELAGVIFLSPTAVFSFFKKNKIDPRIPAFVIGATTAEAVRLRCDNPRLHAEEPSIDSVIDKVIEFFSHRQAPQDCEV